MSTELIPNWESIIHKNIRSSDGESAGNVVAIKGHTIFIESQRHRWNNYFQQGKGKGATLKNSVKVVTKVFLISQIQSNNLRESNKS